MAINEISPHEVVVLARQAMAMPLTSDNASDEALLAALVRRSASIHCPCSPRTLLNAVSDHLVGVSDDPELDKKIEDAIEKSIIAGDLLELRQATTSDPDVKSTWVFAASPAFIVRPSGTIFISGVANDDPTPLPSTLAPRIVYDRHFRKIEPEAGEDLPGALRGLGLIELHGRTWLRTPKQETAQDHVSRLTTRLNASSASGEIADLEIIDPEKDPLYYRGRWVTPKHHSGIFVARRPQAYGSPLWGLTLLVDGVAQKFLDFPLSPWMRGAECAWRAQMAIDACNKKPQRYKVLAQPSGTHVHFFSPLPSWAERRLAVLGSPIERDRSLFGYSIPINEFQTEEQFLQTDLWLAHVEIEEHS